MTLDELITQTPNLDAISNATVAHWAVVYTRGHDEADVWAAIARERCRRALVAAIATTHTAFAAPTGTPPPVTPITAASIRRWRVTQVTPTRPAAPRPSKTKRSPRG